MNIKQIQDYENYFAGEDGNIYRRIKPSIMNKYYGLTLSKNSRHSQRSVHRLIAETFIPNPENKPQVCHIDGNNLNNKLDNLKWGTYIENEADKARHGRTLRGTKNHNCKLSEKQVRYAKHCLNIGVDKNLIAKVLNVSRTVIYHMDIGKTWTHITA